MALTKSRRTTPRTSTIVLSSAETTPFGVDIILVISSTMMATMELRSVSTASTTSNLYDRTIAVGIAETICRQLD